MDLHGARVDSRPEEASLLQDSLARATPVWKNRGLVTALHTTSSDGMQLADIVGRAAVVQLTQV